MTVTQNSVRNKLLQKCTPEDWLTLEPHLKRYDLADGEVFARPGEVIQHVYFFEEGLSLEMIVNADGQEIEGGCFGYEGMAPTTVILGVQHSLRMNISPIGGAALRLPAHVLSAAMCNSLSFQSLMLRYMHVMIAQLAQTTIANGRYRVRQRLARWILLCQDRLGDELHLSHLFLSVMLGVRRAGVTDALHLLEGEHAIRTGRMTIKVLDRAKLLSFAAGSYGVAEAEYERLISAAS
jgi:CRP-like cAMP-binding protein